MLMYIPAVNRGVKAAFGWCKGLIFSGKAA
jgi:hypothetical protein